jgi:hypothetical protein
VVSKGASGSTLKELFGQKMTLSSLKEVKPLLESGSFICISFCAIK